MMKRICVFCGSSPGRHPEYLHSAHQLGYFLAERHIGLVYGGSWVGMMGQVARAALEKGGEVIGVIPEDLFNKGVAFTELADLRVVKSMHERKALMAELSDGFIALPGGLGTIEEFFEMLTWSQLGLHSKPCGLLNVLQYYSPLMSFLDVTVEESFVESEHLKMILIDEDPRRLLDQFESYQPPTIDKAAWILSMHHKQD